MTWLYVAALAIPAAGPMAWALWRRWEPVPQDRLILCGLMILFGASGAVAYSTLRFSVVYGSIHYFLVLASSIAFLKWVIGESESFWLLFVPLATVVILLIMAVPIAVLTYFTSGTVATIAQAPSEISTEPIVESLARIREALDSVEEQVSTESKSVDALTSALVQEIESRNEELRNTQVELEHLSQEVERYKALASLSGEQAQAVVNSLRRERYVDWFVGFVSGLITSGVFFVAETLYRRRAPPGTPRTP